MYRPKKVTLRLSEDEYLHLKSQAGIAGFKMEPFLRKLVMGAQLRPRPPDELAAITRELNAIGVNINQIARKVNTDKQAEVEQMKAIQGWFAALWRRLEGL